MTWKILLLMIRLRYNAMDNLLVIRSIPKIVVLFVLAGLVSCSRMEEAEKPVLPENTETPRPDARVFIGYTPSAEDATKTVLDAQAKMFWQTGDRIALFQSSTNEKYLFSGEDGSTWSEFVKDDETVAGEAYSTNYALYPWAEEVASATEGTLRFTLPAIQTYAVKSFAQNTNPMVAVTASSASNELSFQNLCGFLQLRLYGDATVRRIRFYGNNNEVLSGAATVTAAYGSEPALALDGEGGKVLTLDCGEGGITLGAAAGAYTPIWLVVPPTAFTKGFTFEIERTTGVVTTKSTSKSVTIARNHALPISAIEVEQAPKAITSFSLSDGVHSYTAFDMANDIISVQVPNGIDMSNMVATFTCEGVNVKVGEVVQESGVTANDFSDFTAPVEYVVTASDASTHTYTVRMFNLPVVMVDTPNHQAIVDKVNWIPLDDKSPQQTKVTIRQTQGDGTVVVDTYDAQIKGRGNSTWGQPKKPYAVKLNKKAEVLGMPKHKRWCLLTNSLGYFFGNQTGYELSRRSESMEWAPHAKYVELILNGEFKGTYLLTEQIKIDENRLNITEIKSGDIEGDAVTGGYLFTYDNTWDEDYKFHSQYFNMPVMFKIPDEDIPDAQFNYVQDYINNFEASLMDEERFATREYLDYIDIDTFIDQYFVWETCGPGEVNSSSDFPIPRSVYYHKDRNGKLKAGPVWDFDTYLFRKQWLICNNAQYYGALFKDPFFVQRVKQKWPGFRAGVDSNGGMVAFIDSLYSVVKYAARRDRVMWPWADYNNTQDADTQYGRIRAGLPAKLDWLGEQIEAMKVNYDNKSGGNEDFGGQQDKGDDFNFGF